MSKKQGKTAKRCKSNTNLKQLKADVQMCIVCAKMPVANGDALVCGKVCCRRRRQLRCQLDQKHLAHAKQECIVQEEKQAGRPWPGGIKMGNVVFDQLDSRNCNCDNLDSLAAPLALAGTDPALQMHPASTVRLDFDVVGNIVQGSVLALF